jgi:hypothetical protein
MLYEHQVWTCEYLGLTSIGPSQRAELEAWMREDATESLTLHQLLQHAHCWLYERRILLPAERKLRDLARSIWLDVERGLPASRRGSFCESSRSEALRPLGDRSRTVKARL